MPMTQGFLAIFSILVTPAPRSYAKIALRIFNLLSRSINIPQSQSSVILSNHAHSSASARIAHKDLIALANGVLVGRP
jgi:hypothetical protein